MNFKTSVGVRVSIGTMLCVIANPLAELLCFAAAASHDGMNDRMDSILKSDVEEVGRD